MSSANFIITQDFLLFSESAKSLYHNYAANMPIIDYHNHLSPSEIASNKKFVQKDNVAGKTGSR